MGISAIHLREYVIIPALNHLGLYSRAAENLLVGTAAVETNTGTYLRQLNNGPGLGIYQIEPATHYYLVNDFLKDKGNLKAKLFQISKPSDNQLICNLAYATAIARLKYLSIDEELPDAFDVPALGAYWKKYYNTEKGKGTIQDFILAYKRVS